MSQKMLFNLVSPPIFVPPTAFVPFHRIQGDSDQLWALHLWGCFNAWPAAAAGSLNVFAGPVGSGAPAFQIATHYVPDIAGEPSSFGKLVKIVDGVAIRGPVDLYVTQGGGNVAPATPIEAPACFGYIVRGAGEGKEERRFFDPGSAVGDQITVFTGGAAIGAINSAPGVWPPVDWADVQTVSDDYIDEITLDMMRGSAPTQVGLAQFTGFPAPAGAPAPLGPGVACVNSLLLSDPMRVRQFDEFPARGAGTLQVVPFSDSSDPVLWNGYYVRG